MCEKNLCRNNKRTTGAEDTQNPTLPTRAHSLVFQLPRTSFGFAEVSLAWRVFFFAHHLVLGHLFTPRHGLDIHQQVTIMFGRASITACVTGSARVLYELLRDEGFNVCLVSRVTDSSVMQVRPVRMSILFQTVRLVTQHKAKGDGRLFHSPGEVAPTKKAP